MFKAVRPGCTNANFHKHKAMVSVSINYCAQDFHTSAVPKVCPPKVSPLKAQIVPAPSMLAGFVSLVFLQLSAALAVQAELCQGRTLALAEAQSHYS